MQVPASQLDKGLLEVVKAGQEAPPLLLRPHVVGVKAQGGLELGKASEAAEIDLVDPAEPVKAQKLIVNPHRRVLGVGGDHPRHIAGDGGGVEALEDADPLVALLDVKAAHVLIAPDGVPNALLAEVSGAQVYPLGGKLRVRGQQRHEVRGEGGAPPHGFGSHDLISGNVDDSQVYLPGHHGVA